MAPLRVVVLFIAPDFLVSYLIKISPDGSYLEHGDFMSIEVVMPQMGESITEGTVSKWLKQVGERVEKDEPVLEISTDKVDAEVPSPGAGLLLEIRHQEGETVEVGTVVAVIGAEGEVATEGPATTGEAPTIISANVSESSVETPETEPAIIEAIPTDAPAEKPNEDRKSVV